MTDRKRPYPLRYRRTLLRLASWLDRRAAAIRAHVLTHTPTRRKVSDGTT